MFTAITRQVLRTKKNARLQAGDGQTGNDRIRLNEKGKKPSKKKSGCC